jgi:Putative MetA-pathway of phenol degradation
MRGRILFASVLLLGASRAAAADEQPICADRPGKANPTCTVPAGMIQIETGLADWVHDRSSGLTTDSVALSSTAFKYGLSDRWNVEVDITPYNWQRVHGGGFSQADSSFGDIYVRSKYRFTSGNGVQVAMNPAIKIPTANQHIGNGKWEAGVAFPIDYSIPKSPLSITLGPELDWIADADGRGHHAAMAQVIGIGWQASAKLNLSAEIWGQWDWDPSGTTRQATADLAIAYLLNNDLQLDAGANFGLNRKSPDLELYTGASVRF